MAEGYQKSGNTAQVFLEILKKPENMRQQEPLSLHTTFRIGGPADFYLEPENETQLKALIEYCRKNQVPYFLIGNGSNLLVSDEGYQGAVISIQKYFRKAVIKPIDKASYYGKEIASAEDIQQDMKQKTESAVLSAGAGILLSGLATFAAEHSLTGLEFAAGIPGTLGGAVMMNAGAYGGEISQILLSARILCMDGTIRDYTNQQLQFGYRYSNLMEDQGIVLSAEFLLCFGEQKEIRVQMADFNRRRREKQPLEYPSAGSTFKRPKGYFAGKLIEEAGLKGYRVGGIEVSEKHSGFVINRDHGTAKEALQLIKDVQRIVLEKSGVFLEPEVHLLGMKW